MLWEWFARFGTREVAFWGANQMVDHIDDLNPSLYGLVHRVKIGDFIVTDIIPQLRNWATDTRRHVRDEADYSIFVHLYALSTEPERDQLKAIFQAQEEISK